MTPGLAVKVTDLAELHDACQAHSELGGLIAMFAKILDDEPAYDF
ncbi:hypothetical protein [Mycolicibacterium vanbaalenii]